MTDFDALEIAEVLLMMIEMSLKASLKVSIAISIKSELLKTFLISLCILKDRLIRKSRPVGQKESNFTEGKTISRPAGPIYEHVCYLRS
jgi:hypothetical protein